MDMKEIFGSTGLLSNYHRLYEERIEQIEMAEFIEEILFDSKIAMVEAGTGTGKSLAYTIPLMLYAKNEGVTVAVSTETRALQKQLVDTEAPRAAEIVEKITGSRVKWSLCLGSTNYLCRYRFERAVTGTIFHSGNRAFLDQIAGKIEKDEIITRFDVSVADDVWNEIAKLPDACLGKRCPFRDGCSHRKAREEWQKADFLIINHYLFFANIRSGGSVFPALDAVVFDEAHSLEDICSGQYGFSVTSDDILEALEPISADFGKKSVMQRLFPLEEKEAIQSLCREAVKETSVFFSSAAGYIPRKGGYHIFRTEAELPAGLIAVLERLLALLRSLEEEMTASIDSAIIYDAMMSRLFSLTENLKVFLYQHRAKHVYWVERDSRSKGSAVSINAEPVDVAGILRKDIFPLYRSIIMVSATLSIRNSFTFIEKRLGLAGAAARVIKSPFDFLRQALLHIPKNILEPDEIGHEEEFLNQIRNIIAITGGRVLILFTSYLVLQKVEAVLGEEGHTLFAQGTMTAADAIDGFRKAENGVLLGTDSMWQGIDLPGDLLRGVIITRIPFDVPDTPVNVMRMEYLSILGIHPFNGYILPQAVLKFKQGFGRLIRSKTDQGIIAVLDSRINSKTYGAVFLKSLPECTLTREIDELRLRYAELKTRSNSDQLE